MLITLILGAHFARTPALRRALYAQRPALADHRIEVWDPQRRCGTAPSALAQAAQAPKRWRRLETLVRMGIAAAERRARAMVVVTDENLLGTPTSTLAARQLYPDAEARLTRCVAALGRIDRIVLQTVPEAAWWSAAWRQDRKEAPDLTTQLALSHQARGWQRVITDIARAVPETDLYVLPGDAGLHDLCALATDHLISVAADLPAPDTAATPAIIDETVLARMAARDADSLAWLRAGADGQATWIDTKEPELAAADMLQAWPARGP